MATIEKRTNGDGEAVYRVKVRLRGFPAATATFPRLTDAKKWASQTEAAIRERRYFKTVEAEKHTLADLIDRYVRDVGPRKGPRTWPSQSAQLAWWRAELGSYRLADVTPARIAEARDKLLREADEKGEPVRGPATVNRYLAALSHVFTLAVRDWQWIEESPIRRVSRPKEPRGRVRFLSDDERARLLEACKAEGDPLYTAVVLALSTGARAGEILGLTWGQVDLARGAIRLEHTKNRERRALPLAGPALELMKARRAAHAKAGAEALVFPAAPPPPRPGSRAPKGPKPVDLRYAWRRALAAAGVSDFRFHDLRHSAASYLAMNGASLAEIAAVLGHKTLAMVKRYAHLSDPHTADVVTRMNRAVFGEDAP